MFNEFYEIPTKRNIWELRQVSHLTFLFADHTHTHLKLLCGLHRALVRGKDWHVLSSVSQSNFQQEVVFLRWCNSVVSDRTATEAEIRGGEVFSSCRCILARPKQNYSWLLFLTRCTAWVFLLRSSLVSVILISSESVHIQNVSRILQGSRSCRWGQMVRVNLSSLHKVFSAGKVRSYSRSAPRCCMNKCYDLSRHL